MLTMPNANFFQRKENISNKQTVKINLSDCIINLC